MQMFGAITESMYPYYVYFSVLFKAEYIAEGIEWSSVNFVDNQECLDLIAKKPTGLLPLLDEECRCVQ